MIWERVIRGSNWGYYDTIRNAQNEPLKPGRYKVRWPDGHISEETVLKSSYSIKIGDMGHDYDSSNSHLYFMRKSHGHPVQVRLRGLEIEVEDPPQRYDIEIKTSVRLAGTVYWNDDTTTEI